MSGGSDVSYMVEQFEFSLVFSLPGAEHDHGDLANAVFGAGFENALVGTGNPKLLVVDLEASGSDAEMVILSAARAILPNLPVGTELREFQPDLVSLADVAEKLEVSRQTLQQRDMPLPVFCGLYRIDEVAIALDAVGHPVAGKRRPRFQPALAKKWFRGGLGARALNAKLTLRLLDPLTLGMSGDSTCMQVHSELVSLNGGRSQT